MPEEETKKEDMPEEKAEENLEDLENIEELAEKAEKELEEQEPKEEPEEIVPTEEKFITISLREAKKATKPYRSRKAVKVIRKNLKRHIKRDVKLSEPLNHVIWEKGSKPPSKVKLRVELSPERAVAYPAKE